MLSLIRLLLIFPHLRKPFNFVCVEISHKDYVFNVGFLKLLQVGTVACKVIRVFGDAAGENIRI